MSKYRTAAILVGGKGTRLRSVVSDVPKPLAPVAGEPFLFIILRQLQSAGISRVVLLTGYQHEKIEAACGDGKQFGLEIIYSREIEPLGTAGAILKAKPYLQESKEFILMNGDTYLDCSLDIFLNLSFDPQWMALIGAMQPEETERFGTLKVNLHNFQIEEFIEKGKSTADSKLVNAGIYRLSSSIFDVIPAEQFCSLETDIFPQLLQKKLILRALPIEGKFVDIGVPESYLAFNRKIETEKGII